MGSTRNTPNKNAPGPKAASKGTAKKAAPRKRAPAKKAAAKQAPPRASNEPTVQIEVRVDNRIVALQDVRKSSVRVSLAGGKLSVAAATADAPVDGEDGPVEQRLADQLQPGDAPTADEFDKLVESATPNEAIEFKADPRVQLKIHEAESVVDKQAREDAEKAKGK